MLKNSSDKNSKNEVTDNNTPENTGNGSASPAQDPPRFVPPGKGSVDILKLLTELEDQIETTSRGPFGTLFRFDEDRFHMTVMKIRANLPDDLKRASRLARELEQTSEETKEQSDRILGDSRQAARAEMERAKGEAAKTREEAQTQAQAMKEAAEAEARRIQEETEAEAQRMIEEARQTGFSMLDSAQMQATQAVAECEITRKAEKHAHEILMRAEEEANAIRVGADDYARDVLTNLETVMAKAMGQIQQGRTLLDRR